jgi:hypothetical protein
MPVVRQVSALPSADEALAAELADEMDREGPPGEPLILEDRLGRTERLTARVFWRKWAGVEYLRRRQTILAAYRLRDDRHPERAPVAETVAVAEGMTWDDPRVDDYLPYRVVPALSGGFGSDEIRKVLTDAGGVEVAPGLLAIPCQTFEEAQAVVARLNARIPNVWAYSTRLPRGE